MSDIHMKQYLVMSFDVNCTTTDAIVDDAADIMAAIAWLWEDEDDVRNNFSIYLKTCTGGTPTIQDFGLYDWSEGDDGMLTYLHQVRSKLFNSSPEKLTGASIEVRLLGNPGALRLSSLQALSEKLIEHDLLGGDLSNEEVDAGIALRIPKRMKRIVEEHRANR